MTALRPTNRYSGSLPGVGHNDSWLTLQRMIVNCSLTLSALANPLIKSKAIEASDYRLIEDHLAQAYVKVRALEQKLRASC